MAYIMADVQQARTRVQQGETVERNKQNSDPKTCGDADVLRYLSRDYLMFKGEAKQMIIAKSLVALFKTETIKMTMVHLLQKWEDDKPAVTDEQKKKKEFPDHP
eukprot:688888-Pyramimonas_sp.AAC.1